jgi:uncharacterized membrane protein YcjF (UPF0283 family)
MAQRNPLNQRYQGDGPGGQTRKSAARAKPVSQAAATVHIKKKPQTDSEKRAARKARQKEDERKAIEKARKKAEKTKAESETAEQQAAPEQPKGFFAKLFAAAPNMPKTEEYRKWRRIYWILLGVGIVCIAISSLYMMSGGGSQVVWMASIGTAYAVIIAAFIVDFRKVRPLIKAHQKQGVGSKTPKQLKHEQESKERAEAIEAARKAAREAKKPLRRRKSSDTIVPGDKE